MVRVVLHGSDKVYGKTCIPRGTYEIKLTMSRRFRKVMPLLIDVEWFSGVRIHKGNKPEDTEGCLLVGTTNVSETDDWIGGSKIAYDRLLVKMEEAIERDEDITIEIV